jgi:hypothetical protein
MKTWFNFLSLSYPAGTQQVSWGKKGEKGEKKEGVSEKQTESLPEQVLHFLKRPPNNGGEIHWVTCPPHTLQKKDYGFTNTKPTVHRLTFLTHISNTM